MANNFSTYFRPRTFSEVVGQETAKAALVKIALADGIAVRSIFLKGAYGCGKTTMCRIFAAAMNDPDFRKNKDVTPENCKDVYAKNSQLYMEFDASVAGNVEAIRNLSERLAYIPEGRRVVVFDECHACSKAALNALLKIVEDGVPNTIFVFASTEDILPTIKSRSLCLDITTVPHALMKQRLVHVASEAEVSITDAQLDLVCMKSNGHMRDALSYLQLFSLVGEDGLRSSYNDVVRFMVACAKADRAKAEEALSTLLMFPVVDIKSSLYTFIRNCYTATSEDKLYAFRRTGLISKFYGFFFTSVNQQALKDEVGLELCFRSLIEKICK